MVSERSFLRSVDLGCPLRFLCVSECSVKILAFIEPNQVIFCVPVDYGTSSSSLSIIPGGHTRYRQGHRGDGSNYGTAECYDDAAA